MSEGAAQLTIIVTAFVVTFALVRFTRIHPLAIGCALPVLAAMGVAVWLGTRPPQSSTEGAAIPFMAIFAAVGSIPAAVLAGLMFGRLK